MEVTNITTVTNKKKSPLRKHQVKEYYKGEQNQLTNINKGDTLTEKFVLDGKKICLYTYYYKSNTNENF